MFHHGLDRNPTVNIAIQHCANEVNAVFTHEIWNPEIAIHNFIDTVEWILLIDDGIEKDTEGPNILLFATVGFPS